MKCRPSPRSTKTGASTTPGSLRKRRSTRFARSTTDVGVQPFGCYPAGGMPSRRQPDSLVLPPSRRRVGMFAARLTPPSAASIMAIPPRAHWESLMRSALFLLVAFAATSLHAAEKNLNVLFIAVDDLRPELGCYGVPIIKSPNIDAIAAKGIVFDRAYCQQAVCSPTRSSLLTGRRPDTTKVYDLVTHFRRALPDVVTLPQAFKNAGWPTQSFGKIYHGGYDDPVSWTEPSYFPRGKNAQNDKTAVLDQDAQFSELQLVSFLQKKQAQGGKNQNNVEKDANGLTLKGNRPAKGPKAAAFEASEKGDHDLADGMIADAAIETLRKVKDKPFFLAVGFMKPHLPFVAPKKYFDLYDPAKIPMAKSKSLPTGAPDYAGNNSGELRGYNNIPDGNQPISDDLARQLKHAYYAATSYMDAQV